MTTPNTFLINWNVILPKIQVVNPDTTQLILTQILIDEDGPKVQSVPFSPQNLHRLREGLGELLGGLHKQGFNISDNKSDEVEDDSVVVQHYFSHEDKEVVGFVQVKVWGWNPKTSDWI